MEKERDSAGVGRRRGGVPVRLGSKGMVRGRKGGGRPRGGVLLVRKSEPMTRVQGGDGIKNLAKQALERVLDSKGRNF